MATVHSESLQPREKQDQQAQQQPSRSKDSKSPLEEEVKMPEGRDYWRCPDPGCKKANSINDASCTQCTLPRQSAQQFKRDYSGREGGGRANKKKNWRGSQGRFQNQDKSQKNNLEGIDMSNPTIQLFQQHSKALDEKHDKYERIVKISRDITVESKRIIFLLHRITSETDKPFILEDAESKFSYIRQRLWKNLASELKGHDQYQFLKAYTGGLQEYVEALSFYNYLHFGKLIDWQEVQKDLTFVVENKPPAKFSIDTKSDFKSTLAPNLQTLEKESNEASKAEVESTDHKKICEKDLTNFEKKINVTDKAETDVNIEESDQMIGKAEASNDESDNNVSECNPDDTCMKQEDAKPELRRKKAQIDSQLESEKIENVTEPKFKQDVGQFELDKIDDEEPEMLTVLVPKGDFILGLADLTGEIMRQAITMISAGKVDICFELLEFLNDIHFGFLRAGELNRSKEMAKKINVLQQSLRKVENACYSLKLKGRHVPKKVLASYFSIGAEDGDQQEI